mmetsp:Transcript_6320/g.20476  ORF Transcript_6320/g.20476 Transcript_6320/m.20476 type:complete len:217 (-) Transcript_6320:756-1406(-)
MMSRSRSMSIRFALSRSCCSWHSRSNRYTWLRVSLISMSSSLTWSSRVIRRLTAGSPAVALCRTSSVPWNGREPPASSCSGAPKEGTPTGPSRGARPSQPLSCSNRATVSLSCSFSLRSRSFSCSASRKRWSVSLSFTLSSRTASCCSGCMSRPWVDTQLTACSFPASIISRKYSPKLSIGPSAGLANRLESSVILTGTGTLSFELHSELVNPSCF